MESEEFEILHQDRLEKDEQDQAKEYWSGISFKSTYTKHQAWSDFMAERVLAFKPRSVFEFGCNAGKNLKAISALGQDVFLSGIDVNEPAILHGRAQGLNLSRGDEHTICILPENAFDVVFTVSVLDHVATPETILKELGRVASRAVLLLEPWLGKEGKVVRNKHPDSGEMVDTTYYSYSWDYPKLANAALPTWRQVAEPYRIPTNLGRFYQLYTLTPQE
jgi:ubiquinone/menaquinone biosynthesis C-methylase UbiE